MGGANSTLGGTTSVEALGGTTGDAGGTAGGATAGLGGTSTGGITNTGGNLAIGGAVAGGASDNTGGRGTGGNAGLGGSTSVGGSATTECAPPLMNCGFSCIDTTNDSAHCGGCIQPCQGGQICSNSTCILGTLRVYTKVPTLPASPTARLNSVGVSLQICNVGTSQVNLGGARIVYWYSTDDAADTQIALSPYSTLSGVTAAALAVAPMRGTTDYSLVVTLPAATSLGPAACISEIQVQVHTPTWIVGYVVSGDWSYLGTTSYALNDHVAIYFGESRVWGTEPS